ncbi:phosphomevalonate kinase [Marasmius crinis-equi]|uniref:Phosphomevalonate kinase n=1 Tax=Marasmius crinis-equi TaxID=585013 RepID=A0ABR3FML4_9AGAR
MTLSQPTVVSAPGKVLVAGGYLVLDPAYSGIVVSASPRFYTVVQAGSGSVGLPVIRVRSPQFENAGWSYSVRFEPTSVEASPENSSKNKFVHLALQNTISLACEARGTSAISEILSQGLEIAIVGDNDFYSQRAQGVQLAQVHKTGLGSSAALITSLVSSLLLHLQVISLSAFEDINSEGRHLAHNVSQFVHCLAQGKVGSGFDVSSAVFGSHIYTRFDPAVLKDVMSEETTRNPRSLFSILSPSNKAWNHRVQPFSLPPLTRLMLADVDAGSDTPSLVGKVLQWRKEDSAKAETIWNELDQHNQSLAKTLQQLTELYSRDPGNYSRALKYISSLQPLQWTADPFLSKEEAAVAETFYNAHQITETIREKMREMGNLAGVPIEPPEQTTLLNECISQAGVIGGGVPGAGGYDAIWLLVCAPEDRNPDPWPFEKVDHFWEHYRGVDVSPLSAVESKAKGLRLENLDEVKGLREAVAATK